MLGTLMIDGGQKVQRPVGHISVVVDMSWIKDVCARAHRWHSHFPPLVLPFLPASSYFQYQASAALPRHQQGGFTTTSASLCYHLPRVYQSDTFKHKYSRFRSLSMLPGKSRTICMILLTFPGLSLHYTDSAQRPLSTADKQLCIDDLLLTADHDLFEMRNLFLWLVQLVLLRCHFSSVRFAYLLFLSFIRTDSCLVLSWVFFSDPRHAPAVADPFTAFLSSTFLMLVRWNISATPGCWDILTRFLRLRLGRRSVNLLPLAQRTKTFAISLHSSIFWQSAKWSARKTRPDTLVEFRARSVPSGARDKPLNLF